MGNKLDRRSDGDMRNILDTLDGVARRIQTFMEKGNKSLYSREDALIEQLYREFLLLFTSYIYLIITKIIKSDIKQHCRFRKTCIFIFII